MRSGAFVRVLIHLHVQDVQRTSKVVILNKSMKNVNKVNVIKIVETLAEQLNIA